MAKHEKPSLRNDHMPYTRRITQADAVASGYPNYRVVMAASPESATVLGCFLGDGGHPPLGPLQGEADALSAKARSATQKPGAVSAVPRAN